VLPGRGAVFGCAAQPVSDARIVRMMAVDSRRRIRTTVSITIATDIHRQAGMWLDDLVARLSQGARERLGAVSVCTRFTAEDILVTMG